MSDELVKAAIVAERTELAGMLGGLGEGQWDAPTLCAGWRVREVVAHMTMPFRMSVARFGVEMVKARGDFNRMADVVARRDAANMSAGELVAMVRDNVAHPWSPPGGGAAGALSHDVIHGLDISVGLGLERRPPPARVGLVLGGLAAKNLKYFGTDLSGVRLEATDVDWGYGDGDPLHGAAQDLLLAVCGRRLPAGKFEGTGAARFAG
jgi:uncharacterized protein (TIGR03083 family)